MAFIIQEATGVGQWQTIGKPYYKSLAAHAVLGKLKAADKSKRLRVVFERNVSVAHPPKLEDLIPFMWLRGFSLRAIDRAIVYVRDISETLQAKKAA